MATRTKDDAEVKRKAPDRSRGPDRLERHDAYPGTPDSASATCPSSPACDQDGAGAPTTLFLQRARKGEGAPQEVRWTVRKDHVPAAVSAIITP